MRWPSSAQRNPRWLVPVLTSPLPRVTTTGMKTDPRRRTSARLVFADHVDYLVACQRAPGSPKRTEALAGVNPPLDGPVVLLQDIIEVRHRPVSTVLLQSALGFELYDGRRVSGVLVGVDDPRVRMVRAFQGFGSESAWRPRVAPSRKKEVDGRLCGIHRVV